ncbi:aminoglycoside adenylyltransferase family protein [Pseudaminobacter sp. NGMCC 1.201702]|uniref:aminoglycoside adenylyltransferase family protein n=1 Tax=Pseudaminobacter sp. NGMCC 1.201702 TaxID=3391825 RepID=UPI0039EF4B6D
MNGDTPTIPGEASQALLIVQSCLGDSLLAVYLHGSAVAGGLRPGSDVDVLVVTNQPTTPKVRECLVAELRMISGRHPAEPGAPRPLELIVFQHADLMASVYPVRSEFVYGEWLREAFEAGVAPEPAADPEFTLLLAQARQEAKTLIGPDPAGLLPIILETDIRRAIGDALPMLLGRLEGDERNVLLTLVRMWRTLATGEFVSKDVAAEWAMIRLPAEPAAVIACAREAYLGRRTDDWQTQHEVRQVVGDLSRRVMAML